MTEKAKNTFFNDVSSQVKSDELELSVLKYWEDEKIFERSLDKNKDGELYTFYDGPPYATGKPHYGHILQSAIKDTVLRYKTMQGYYVPRRVGWDCHGLPVETLVEKELGFKSKKDIEQYGIKAFNQKCRDTVFKYIDEFTKTMQRIGRWSDYANAYATLNQEYIESEWWAFKQLWDQELVYKDFRSTPYCIRCATPLSNFEVTSNYHDRIDTAVYVLLKVKGEENLYLAIWTTTPWTLPGNVAVAINPELSYVTVEHEGKDIIIAESRVASTFDGQQLPAKKKWTTEELLKLTYEPLYNFTEAPGAYVVVPGEHVTADDGTGLVHTATAFGEEDAALGKKHNLPVIKNVDTNGRFMDEVKPWAGQKIFDVNGAVVEDLKERGLLLKQEQFKHSYPYCWRCDEPLIYYALDSWFVKISAIKERMLKINEEINWTPKHVKKGRFAKGIESAPDWAVSRNRFWSVPIPVWQCEECEERVCVGSFEELKKLSGQSDIPDVHRPFVDELTWQCSECDGTMKRVEEVLDVWFDSASMPYSQWHYPFERKKFVEKGFPADFIAESIEQTRAWFYVLHVLSTALTTKDIGFGVDKPAYKNVIGSGIIFAEDGQKLSKKLKNYPEPEPTIAKYGADVLRFYLLASTKLGEPYRFSEKDMRQMQRNMYITLWNVYSFFVRYANTHEWFPKEKIESTNLLDRWMMARLVQFENEVQNYADHYQIDYAAKSFINFVDELSNWYVRRSRNRFQKPVSHEERNAAFSTLYEVLVRLSKLMAPFMPFVSEEMYRNLTQDSSVHLEQLDRPQELTSEQKELLETMEKARAVVSESLALRATNAMRIRQPLAELVVVGDALGEELTNIIRDEVNVKKISFVDELPTDDRYKATSPDSRVKAALDLEVTPELKREGLARDIIRQGQVLRREAGYALDDRITLVFVTEDVELQEVIKEQRVLITTALQADHVSEAQDSEDIGADLKVDKKPLHLGVRK